MMTSAMHASWILRLGVVALCIAPSLCQPPSGVTWKQYDNVEIQGDVMLRDFKQYCAAAGTCEESGNFTAAKCASYCSKAVDANAYAFCNNPSGCGSGCLAWKAKYASTVAYPFKNFRVFTEYWQNYPAPKTGCQGVLSGAEVDRWPYRMCTCLKVPDPTKPTFAPAVLPPSGAWQCLKRFQAPLNNTPFRWTGAQPECASFDGQRCMKPANCTTALADVKSRLPGKALTCGAQHRSVYGRTGYETNNTWCSAARRAFVPASGVLPPLGKWRCLKGLPAPFQNTPMRWMGLNPQCASLDGRTCLKPASCNATLADLEKRVWPLTCGPYHESVWGVDGYDKPTNWCPAARKALVPHSGWQSGTLLLPSGTCSNVRSPEMASICLSLPATRQASYAACVRNATSTTAPEWVITEMAGMKAVRGMLPHVACYKCATRPSTATKAQLDLCWKGAASSLCVPCITGFTPEPDQWWSCQGWPSQADQEACLNTCFAGTPPQRCYPETP